MKTYTTLFLLLVFCSALRAQTDPESDPEAFAESSPFLLPVFGIGSVHFRSGGGQEAALNYNVLFQQMIFKKDGGLLALDKLAAIDTVAIGGRKFIPVDTVFYEVALSGAAVPLYIHYSARLMLAGTNIGFNSNNQTAPSDNPESFRIGNVTPYDSKLPDKYKVVRQTEFLVKKKDGFFVLTSARRLGDVFPGKEKALRQYMRDHDITWGKVEDMEKLFGFGNLSGN